MAQGPPAAKGLSGDGSETAPRVRVFTFNHSLCRRGEGGTDPKETGVRVGQSPSWAMPRSSPQWASGPDGRAMDKADRGQSGGGFQRLAEVPKVT